jgi:hypothetical protein
MRNCSRVLNALGVAFAFGLLSLDALAQTAYLATNTRQLLRIDLSAPGAVQSSVGISGLVGSDALVALDFRPATGQLYGLSNGRRLYVVNTATGAASLVGAGPVPGLAGVAFGFDFNPTVDRIRVVNDVEQNLRLDPGTGAVAATDSALAYAAADPNFGAGPTVVGSAYTNNIAGTGAPTALYGIDTGLNILVVQEPPNSGALNTVGPLGVDVELVPGFDVRSVPGVNAAYAVMRVAGVYGLYTINLATGAATLVGNLPAGTTIAAFAVPTPSLRKAEADVNGDGRSDIVYRNNANGLVHRLLMNGTTVSSSNTIYYEPNLACKIVGDGAVGTGTSDLLWRNSSTGEVYFMPFGTNGAPAPGGGIVHTEPNPNWEIVQTPDINGDGRSDLVWMNMATGEVYLMLLNGASIIAQGTLHVEPDPNWSIVAVLAAAGDNRRNRLVWQNAFTGQVYLMTVTVSGSTFTRTNSDVFTEPNDAWRIVGAPDLDGDGGNDLLLRNVATGQVYGLLMTVGGRVDGQNIFYQEPNLAWKIVATGDYNGDGKSDILWRNESTGQVDMMLMNRLTVISRTNVYTEPNTAWRVMGPYEYGVQ